MSVDFRSQYESYRQMVEYGLAEYLPNTQIAQAKLLDAMLYSVFSGGKRIRPVLLLAFCETAGGDTRAALPFACALEMIHTYSLIHDDLPCMDDDDMRRGRPANHRMFGEASAVLAGDALLSAAFETMLDADYVEGTPPAAVLSAAHRIAWASGLYGMAGGQLLDLETETFDQSVEGITARHLLKTGALIEAAAEVGCELAGASREQMAAAASFARCLGLAFQIRDDLLDEEGDPMVTGKLTGVDRENNRVTFLSLLGRDECVRIIDDLTKDAVGYLTPFENHAFLAWLAEDLAHRKG
ncbi:MAG: polyprenyl synthetase family protein [Oscillospiraceae bacterium]|nr:polyprenyl synthetase family protein [Oscillospiraceae bacterium]